MKTNLIGYKGRNATQRAHRASNQSLPKGNTRIRELSDGGFVGVGGTIARGGSCDNQDVMLYGARGTTCWASEHESQSVLSGE